MAPLVCLVEEQIRYVPPRTEASNCDPKNILPMALLPWRVVGGLLLGAVGKVLLLHTVLFPILASDSIAMVHVDPSIIINTPFAPLERLILFVGSSLALQLLLLSTTTNATTTRMIGAAYTVVVTYYTIVLYAIFILCGITPTMGTARHTFLAAFHVVVTSSLSAIELVRPPRSSSAAATTTTSDVTSFWDTVRRVDAHLLGTLSLEGSVETTTTLHGTTSWQQNQKQTRHRTTTSQQQQQDIHQYYYYYYYYYYMYYGSIIGMIVASILRVLDIGLQVQRHPMPIILGYTYGSIGGLLVWIVITSFETFITNI